MQNSGEEQKNNMKVPPFPSLIPNIFLQVLFFLFYFIAVLIIATIVFEVEVRCIICDASIQSSCHQPTMSTF